MTIPLYGMNLGIFDAKTLGEVWTPKAQRLRVGSEIMGMSMTGAGGKNFRNSVLADGEHVRFKSTQYFESAKRAAMNGQRVSNFRALDDAAFLAGQSVNVSQEGGEEPAVAVLFENSTHRATYSAGKIQIRETGGEGKLLQEVAVSGDMRISFDDDMGLPLSLEDAGTRGSNPSFTIHTGADALTEGKLAARGDDEVLIRVSGVDVEAGDGTTVFNLSSQGGAFGGGSSVTYLGAYQDSTFEGGAYTTTYAGYFASSTFTGSTSNGGATNRYEGVFENSDLSGGDSGDYFSGYFSASTVSGKGSLDEFSGMFINGSTVNGDDGDDDFLGRFVDSLVNGGMGANHFGYLAAIPDRTESFVTEEDENGASSSYQGIASDFVDSTITGGEGADVFDAVMSGGSVNLGAGDDTVKGIFASALVTGADGDDAVDAMYSRNSTFETGAGEDSVFLSTAVNNVVRTQEGTNTVRLGYNMHGGLQDNGYSVDGDMKERGWQTYAEAARNDRPIEFGELDGNQVLAEEGDNTVHVNNGQGTNRLITGGATGGAEGAQENVASDVPPKASENADSADGVAAEEGMAAGESRRHRAAVERYVLQFGDAPLEDGPVAAVVDTGAGEIALSGLRRDERERQPEGLQRYTRRSNGFGAYDVLRSKLW